MKLGVNTWVWVSPFTTKDLDLLDKIARIGYDIVEVAVEDTAHFDAAALKRKLADTGLGVTLCGAFGPSRDISDLDPALRAGGREYIEDCIRLAEKLDCRIFAGPVYSAVGKARLVPKEQKQREWANCVENLKALGPMAHDAGVTICIEPLNRFETDMINVAEQAKALIAEAGSPPTRCTWTASTATSRRRASRAPSAWPARAAWATSTAARRSAAPRAPATRTGWVSGTPCGRSRTMRRGDRVLHPHHHRDRQGRLHLEAPGRHPG